MRVRLLGEENCMRAARSGPVGTGAQKKKEGMRPGSMRTCRGNEKAGYKVGRQGDDGEGRGGQYCRWGQPQRNDTS